MKKHILIIAACILTFVSQSQQVQRDKVILEMGTATW